MNDMFILQMRPYITGVIEELPVSVQEHHVAMVNTVRIPFMRSSSWIGSTPRNRSYVTLLTIWSMLEETPTQLVSLSGQETILLPHGELFSLSATRWDKVRNFKETTVVWYQSHTRTFDFFVLHKVSKIGIYGIKFISKWQKNYSSKNNKSEK